MINLLDQEKQPEIQKLKNALKTVSCKTKEEHEWQFLENTIVSKLEDTREVATKTSFLSRYREWGPVFSRKFSISSAVLAIALIFGFGINTFYASVFNSPTPLVNSSVIQAKGSVSYSTSDNATAEVFDEQIYKTGEDGTIIVILDQGSSFILFENTKLIISKANEKEIKLYLDRGTILASVSKRKDGQKFSVVTDDAICDIIGTIFNVSVSPTDINSHITNLTVIEGKVKISDRKNLKNHTFVNSGEITSLHDHVLSEPYAYEENLVATPSVTLIKQVCEISKNPNKPQGIIEIESTPSGAKIMLGNKIIGTTPMTLNHDIGTYSITLNKEGFDSWQKNIAVSMLTTTSISAKIIESKITIAPDKKKKTYTLKKRRLRKNVKPVQKANTQRDTKDFEFIRNPAFVEALMQMTIGEYHKAIIILDSLKDIQEISITEKIRIMSKISACYKGMGNFVKTIESLTYRYNNTNNTIARSNLLWEIITVKSNCLQDYMGAEKDIQTYIKDYPGGPWIESAYAKSGEIQYITGKYAKAVGSYQYHINFFKNSNVVEKSIYTLANIMRQDIKDFQQAVKWYTKLMEEYPASKYFSNALFERAECHEKLKNKVNARIDYQTYIESYPKGRLNSLCSTRLSSILN